MIDSEQFELKLEHSHADKLLSLLAPAEIYARIDGTVFIQLKEDRRVERKSAKTTPRVLGEYFSMWSNSSPLGGLIFVGVENDGEVTGCGSCSVAQINDLEDCPRIMCPDARVESTRVQVTNSSGKDDFVIVYHVPYRRDKVVRNSRSDAFVRSGDKKRQFGEDEIRELQIAKGEVQHELEPVSIHYPEDFDKPLLKEFSKNVRLIKELSYAKSIRHILAQQRLGSFGGFGGEEFSPNNACCLLFARDPLLHFPGCKIRVMRFDGESERTGEKYALIKDIHVEHQLPKLIMEAEKAIKSQLREYSAVGADGRFYAVPEYPETAWYEAVVNACVHRSWNLKNMYIFVKIFDDRMEIISPGGFPPLVTPQNIFTAHNPRNPFLMDALRYFGFVKCANEGTNRMREAMVKNSLPEPRFGETQVSDSINVIVTLQNDYKQRRRFIDSDAVSGVVTATLLKGLTAEDKRLINYVAEFENVSVTQAARTLGRDWGTAKKRLEILVGKGILLRKARKDLARDPKAKYFLNK